MLGRWWRRLWRAIATLPYRGAPVSMDAHGRIVAHPAITRRELRRNLARLQEAMRAR